MKVPFNYLPMQFNDTSKIFASWKKLIKTSDFTFGQKMIEFEKKFAKDEELKFKLEARSNKYLGEWVSQILSLNSDQEKVYIQSVIKADFAEVGDQDVFRKIKEDLKEKNISDEDLRKKMDELNEKAKTDFN